MPLALSKFNLRLRDVNLEVTKGLAKCEHKSPMFEHEIIFAEKAIDAATTSAFHFRERPSLVGDARSSLFVEL